MVHTAAVVNLRCISVNPPPLHPQLHHEKPREEDYNVVRIVYNAYYCEDRRIIILIATSRAAYI